MDKLFIPKTIKAGFVKRDDTFNGKLGYVIYTDDKGVLRKKAGWESWRNKKIEPEDHSNKPSSGFFINKGIQRYSYHQYGLNQAKMRIYDSERGIEFEITLANLSFILMHTNCVKRELEGEFVYAWDGPELVLMPTECAEYKACMEYTGLRDTKVTAKDMTPGCVYTEKRGEEYLYLGHLEFYSPDNMNNYRTKQSRLDVKAKKHHVYVNASDADNMKNLKGIKFKNKGGQSWLSRKNSDDIHPRYAEIMEVLGKSHHACAAEGLVIKDKAFNEVMARPHGNYYTYGRDNIPKLGECINIPIGVYWLKDKKQKDYYRGYKIQAHTKGEHPVKTKGYYMYHVSTVQVEDGAIRFSSGEGRHYEEHRNSWYNRNYENDKNPTLQDLSDFRNKDWKDLKIKFEDGQTRRVDEAFGVDKRYGVDKRLPASKKEKQTV